MKEREKYGGNWRELEEEAKRMRQDKEAGSPEWTKTLGGEEDRARKEREKEEDRQTQVKKKTKRNEKKKKRFSGGKKND